MNYQNFASLGVNLNRQKYGPLDISNVFTSAADLKYYLTKGTFTEGVSEYWYKNANEKIVPYPYEGQVLATVIDGVVEVFVLAFDAEGNFETREIAGKIEVDGTTIVKDANGKLSIVAPVNPDSTKTYNFSYANGVYSWVEVDTATAAGQAQAIAGLTDRTVALETTVNGKAAVGEEGAEGYQPAVVGLVDKVAALEAVDNATQAELDAYKEVVTAAIAAGVKEAKDYADAQDADTVYDDTELAGRVSAIEADYLKTADKYDDTELAGRVTTIENDYLKKSDETIYDDTALAGRVTTVEGKVADLEDAVAAIDYIDADELADALAPINEALGTKAAQADLETLKGRVDTFFEGTGVENVIDTLEDLINFINTHDDVEVSGILASIEAIEGKLAGIDSTVAAYVTAAIEALKIGDYAKAADLTALVDRVAVLEAKPFDTYATKTEVQGVDAKFADYTTTSDLNTLLADKADVDSVVANTAFETFKGENTTAIATAKQEAIDAAKAAEEAKGYAVDADVKATYATKAELTTHEESIANDLLAYAKTADVNKELAKKVESATIVHAIAADPDNGIEAIPEGVTKDGATLKIVVDAPTRAETTQMIADKVAAVTGGESAAAVKLLVEAETERSIAKDEAHDAALATLQGDASKAGSVAEAKALAQKGVDDAAAVAANLVTANAAIADNAREIGVAKDSINTVNNTLTEKITALENADTKFTGDIASLQGIVSGEGGHASRITALEGRATNLEAKDTELAALIQSNTDKFAGYYTKGEVDAAVITSGEVVRGAADSITIANNKITVTLNSYTKGEVDDLLANLDQTALETGIANNASDIAILVGDDKDAETGRAAKSVRAIAAEEAKAEVAALVGEAPDALDTIHEIASWIENDTTGAAAMSAEIAEHSAILSGFGGEGQPATVATAIATAKAEAIEAATFTLGVATAEKLGGVKSASGDNKVAVAEDGVMSVATVNVSTLAQTAGDVLVLNGGSAAV